LSCCLFFVLLSQPHPVQHQVIDAARFERGQQPSDVVQSSHRNLHEVKRRADIEICVTDDGSQERVYAASVVRGQKEKERSRGEKKNRVNAVENLESLDGREAHLSTLRPEERRHRRPVTRDQSPVGSRLGHSENYPLQFAGQLQQSVLSVLANLFTVSPSQYVLSYFLRNIG
ncbi:hypothetical protein PMAYCL1PPCAC_14382, partial [Pristionchus mayeri]